MPRLATALLEGLKAYDASEIFGIPGEPVVGFAADVAARYRRRGDRS